MLDDRTYATTTNEAGEWRLHIADVDPNARATIGIGRMVERIRLGDARGLELVAPRGR